MLEKTKDINENKKLIEKGFREMLEEKQKIMEKEKKICTNYITSEFFIKEKDINADIRIINSFEEFTRTYNIKNNEKYFKCENEEEIREKCEIKINDKIIPFNYFYKFKKEGKYEITYIFKENIIKTDYMFSSCNSLAQINFSNFNSENVTNMRNMFFSCKSLISINFSNFNTQNVTNMADIFSGCKSLSNLDLSKFNTQNVIDMSYMFYDCNSLINLDLSNFNTNNVTDMSRMFNGCFSFKNLNLDNFNTQNVKNMNKMFCGCNSLIKINLFNFNSQNVIDMNSMFSG